VSGELITLPWGSEMEINARDTVGRALSSQGLYDIVTSEVLWRLTENGDTAFDVGANIGYFASLMSKRAGPLGAVLAFEPHPETFSILQRNAARTPVSNSRITPFQLALSNTDGEATLDLAAGDECNTSHAFLNARPSRAGITVRTARGEHYIDPARGIGVMKIDTQSHEACVLEGLGDYLRLRKIRDIVFEEESMFPSPSHTMLLNAGYSIFWFEERFRGPRIIAPTAPRLPKRAYDIAPSYLATLDPIRATNRLTPFGWRFF